MNNSNSNKWSAFLIFIAASATLFVGCATGEHKAMKGVVKEAKAEGADAVIVLSSEYQVLGSSTVGSGIGSVQGTATSFGPTTTFNGTENVNYASSTVIHGAQSGSVALVKYIDVRR
jgi:hypothetical protein